MALGNSWLGRGLLGCFVGIMACEAGGPPTSCTTDEDCVVVRRACLTRAVNQANADEVEEEFSHIQPNCARPPGGVWPALEAECVESRCRIVGEEEQGVQRATKAR